MISAIRRIGVSLGWEVINLLIVIALVVIMVGVLIVGTVDCFVGRDKNQKQKIN